MAIATLITGLVILVLAGDALVRGAVSAAQRLHIPPLVIGLTVVSFGTSAPELIVSLEAALSGAPGLAVGNVVGSNIANILLVLGLPAVITPIVLEQAGIRRSALYMIAVSIALALMGLDGHISRLEGIALFALLLVYLVSSGIAASRSRSDGSAATELAELDAAPLPVPRTLVFVTLGIVGLGLGGNLTIRGALGVADMLGVAESAVGLTIVALGTSLPELATSVAAALRKHTGVVIGNVIGSNIFNVLGILGLTAALVPLDIDPAIMRFDIWVMLAAAVAMVPIAFATRRVNRVEGVVMTLAYIAYSLAVLRNQVPV